VKRNPIAAISIEYSREEAIEQDWLSIILTIGKMYECAEPYSPIVPLTLELLSFEAQPNLQEELPLKNLKNSMTIEFG
jgi:hypothetical protein